MNKITSGILAVCIYLGVIFLILLYYNVHKIKSKNYVEKNSNRITVTLVNSDKTVFNRSSKISIPKKPTPINRHHLIKPKIPSKKALLKRRAIAKKRREAERVTRLREEARKRALAKKREAERIARLREEARKRALAKKREAERIARLREEARKRALAKKREAERIARLREEARKRALAKKREAERIARLREEARKRALAKKREAERIARLREEARKRALAKKREAERIARLREEARKRALAKKREAERIARLREEAKKRALAKKREAERIKAIKEAKAKRERERLARIRAERERKRRIRERAKNLFSSIKTPKHSTSKEPRVTHQRSHIRHQSSIADRIKNTHLSGRVSNRNRDKGVVNAYIAKVKNQLNNWNAQSDYKGQSATIRLTIMNSGHFRYSVKHSSSVALTRGLKRFLDQLNRIGLGVHSKSTPYIIEVTFKAK